MNTKTCKILVIVSLLLAGLGLSVVSAREERGANQPNTGMADSAAIINLFDRFLARLPSLGGGRFINLTLVGLRGLGSESFNAGGAARVDVTNGAVTSQVNGLPADGSFELWLADNRPAPGHSTLAERADALIRVGAYQFNAGTHTLAATLGAEQLNGVNIDRAFVTRAGQSPLDAFVLTGAASVFDRFFRRQARFVDQADAALGFDPTAEDTRAQDFARLVAQGRQLFVKETFNGNGRTCATCHVESNNFTIDPQFIATLPRHDPLFVAETNPALAANFEKPELMRKLGVFIENADGFDDLANKFTLRSTQTLLAVGNSLTAPDPVFGIDFTTNGKNPNPLQRLGWSNDGVPGREFAIVAITQHNPKTLGRKAGADFRVPTDEELDALAAYQLSLGRQEDFNLQTLELKTSQATQGKTLFLDTGNIGEPGHKNCNSCHFNAGGTAAMNFNPASPNFSPRLDSNPRGFNVTSATNANETPLALALRLPRDGGFGALPLPTGGFGNLGDIPGVGTIPVEEFNSPPLVESADTAPFFHNHTIKDLESAIAFYGTAAFKDSLLSIGNSTIGATPVKISDNPNDPEVQAIAAFLRVLNALENIRSSISLAERGRMMADVRDARDLAALALAETEDARESLTAGALAKNREAGIASARAQLQSARLALELARRSPTPALARFALERATRNLRDARAALANPATLPPSYQN